MGLLLSSDGRAGLETYFRLDVDLLIVYNYTWCSHSMREYIMQMKNITSTLNSVETIWIDIGRSPVIILCVKRTQTLS